MPRLRKSKSSGDLSASVPTFPAGLFQRLTSQRDSKALALSSASIALSVGSAFSSTPGISGDVATSREMVTGWQTAYAAARMAVEITKESSDMFLPLKAAVGAVSVLVQNYDVSVPCPQIRASLNLCLLPCPANGGQCQIREGYRAEGSVSIRRACFSCTRGRLCREREESRTPEVCPRTNTH